MEKLEFEKERIYPELLLAYLQNFRDLNDRERKIILDILELLSKPIYVTQN